MAPGNETCARCGAVFECGMKAGAEACWCAELPPIFPVAGDGCLCRACLRAQALARVGLCLECRHRRLLKSKGGSAIFFCALSETDAAFPKYPRLPVSACSGHQTPAPSAPTGR